MSEADGALISHLDDLQARLSRVAALSAPVDVAVGSVRSSPARALKKRAAHSPRPTSLVSPLASPALEGRAAYYQTRDVVPGRAKRRYEIPSRHEPGGSDTKRGSPSLHATHHHETRLGRSMTGRHFFSSPPMSPAARVAAESSDQQLDEPRERESGNSRPSPPRSPRQFSSGLTGTVTERPSFRDDDPAFEKNKNAAATVAELDATRARALAAESGLRAARGEVAVLAERLRMAGEAEAAHAERVAAIVEEAERVALEATRAQGTGTRGGAAEPRNRRVSPRTAAPEEGTRRKKKKGGWAFSLGVARGGGARRGGGGARGGRKADLGARGGPRARERAGPETRGSLPAGRGPRRRRGGVETEALFALFALARRDDKARRRLFLDTLLRRNTNAREGRRPRHSPRRVGRRLGGARGDGPSGGARCVGTGRRRTLGGAAGHVVPRLRGSLPPPRVRAFVRLGSDVLAVRLDIRGGGGAAPGRGHAHRARRGRLSR